MKKLIICAGILTALALTQKSEAQVRIGLNLHIGDPTPVYYYNDYGYYHNPPQRVIVTRPYRNKYYDRDRYYYERRNNTKYNRYQRYDRGNHNGWDKNRRGHDRDRF
jgi:hypothetical protein